MGKVLAICIDGYEDSIGQKMMNEGRLPALAKLRDTTARFDLHHGPPERTGLAGEHFSTGLTPDASHRWASVSFDKESYKAWQAGNTIAPFPAGAPFRTVVFDQTYFNMDLATEVRGLVNWGAHDPGVPPRTRPEGLLDEIRERFGDYPAAAWLYGFAWPSPSRCAEMGRQLAAAAKVRTEAAHWLLKERMPDWDLGIVTSGELHSASESLWHGIDTVHPLHHAASSAAAAEALLSVYEAIDAMVGRLADAFPEADVVLFTMGGMGPNRSDVPSMLLLSELMYRNAFGAPLLQTRPEWLTSEDGCPVLDEEEKWGRVMMEVVPAQKERKTKDPDKARKKKDRKNKISLGWMPASRYQPFWSRMEAFALPSFYDGRIRINLAGREANGVVPLEAYRAKLDEIKALVEACIDPRTGESAVDFIEETAYRDPLRAGETECDLCVVWRGTVQSFEHPTLGKIGPVPFNRVGGHTGDHGIAYIRSAALEAGYHGRRSSFDVAPSLFDLLGAEPATQLSGTSLLRHT